MSELLKADIKKKLGFTVILYLKNNFRYSGILIDVDNEFVKLNDSRDGIKLISLASIETITFGGGNK